MKSKNIILAIAAVSLTIVLIAGMIAFLNYNNSRPINKAKKYDFLFCMTPAPAVCESECR